MLFVAQAGVGVGVGEASTAREGGGGGNTYEDHHVIHDDHHHHHHHQIDAAAAFHVSRPTLPISTIISPAPLHHASIVLDDHLHHHHHHHQDSYHVPSMLVPNQNFQVILQAS